MRWRRREKEGSRLGAEQARTLVVGAGLGLLGLLPGEIGDHDPVALLAWLTLVAPAAGALVGATGLRALPYGAAVPAIWCLALVRSDLTAARHLATPMWAAVFLLGLFAIGMAVGRCFPDRGPTVAGLVLLFFLGACGLSVQAGVASGGASWAATQPGLARVLLEVSPLVWAYDCAGWDWTHGHPDVYALSGVEWFARRPFRSSLAAPLVLVVGCVALVLTRFPTRRPRG